MWGGKKNIKNLCEMYLTSSAKPNLWGQKLLCTQLLSLHSCFQLRPRSVHCVRSIIYRCSLNVFTILYSFVYAHKQCHCVSFGKICVKLRTIDEQRRLNGLRKPPSRKENVLSLFYLTIGRGFFQTSSTNL